MEAKLEYLGPDWRAEAFKRLREELKPEKMNGITTSMANLYSDCPGGVDKWLFVSCVEGKVERFETGSGPAPDAEFRIAGSYETFSAISRAELGSQRALMTGKLKLRGNMAKALRLAPLADRINKVLSTIPSTF